MKYLFLVALFAFASTTATANDVDKAKRVAFGESPAPIGPDPYGPPNAGRGGADYQDTDESDANGGNG